MNPLPLKLKTPLSKAKLLMTPGEFRMQKVWDPQHCTVFRLPRARLFGAELEPD